METRAHFKVNPFKKGLRIFAMVIMGAVGVSAMAFLFGYFVMLLWNWLMPSIFDLRMINFWEAAGIIILARLIFGGFKHGDHDKSHKCGPGGKKDHIEHWVKYGRSFKGDKWNKWKHYDEFWEKEGKEKFDDYIKQKEEGNSDE